MWLTDHWQFITGTASLLTFAGLSWRFGIRVLRAQKRADECAEDLRTLTNSLKIARAELDYLQSSADRLIQTATDSSRKPPSENKP